MTSRLLSSMLIPPYGGALAEVMASDEEQRELRARARDWPSWDLTPRQTCDLELLLSSGFSPLAGFLGQRDYESVRDAMRLGDGTLWPVPIVLDVSAALAGRLTPGTWLSLRDAEGVMLAALEVNELWQPDLTVEAQQVYGTLDPEHPGVDYLMHQVNPVYVAGRLRGLRLPDHYDFRLLRHTPEELRAQFQRRGWLRVMAFHTRNPIERPQAALTQRLAREHQANLLLHPVVGTTRPGDVDHFTRGRCYQAVMDRFPSATSMLSLLPLSMRLCGPREALLHAIVRQNHGCTHIIVGPDQGGAGLDREGRPFYPRLAAQEFLDRCAQELGIRPVPARELVWVRERSDFAFSDEVPPGAAVASMTGNERRRLLARGCSAPDWFTFPEVERELRRTYPPRHRQGFTVFFTGLSGAGKSTIANVLLVRLLEMGGRPVTLLDGDIVRKHLSSELTFSKEHRDINIRRIGFVASEISKNGGIAICAPIAPFHQVRKEVRQMVSQRGGFILVHVATPIGVCEQRDRKGMYAKARAGLIPQFTGVSDPYEEPEDADLILDTSHLTPQEAAQQVLLFLEKEGYLASGSQDE